VLLAAAKDAEAMGSAWISPGLLPIRADRTRAAALGH
jgi:hypothetical protein